MKPTILRRCAHCGGLRPFRCLGSGFSLDYSPVPGLPFGKHFLQNVRSAAAAAVFSEMVDVHTPLLRELHATARGPILMWITPALERPYLHLSLIDICNSPCDWSLVMLAVSPAVASLSRCQNVVPAARCCDGVNFT